MYTLFQLLYKNWNIRHLIYCLGRDFAYTCFLCLSQTNFISINKIEIYFSVEITQKNWMKNIEKLFTRLERYFMGITICDAENIPLISTNFLLHLTKYMCTVAILWFMAYFSVVIKSAAFVHFIWLYWMVLLKPEWWYWQKYEDFE